MKARFLTGSIVSRRPGNRGITVSAKSFKETLVMQNTPDTVPASLLVIAGTPATLLGPNKRQKGKSSMCVPELCESRCARSEQDNVINYTSTQQFHWSEAQLDWFDLTSVIHSYTRTPGYKRGAAEF